MNYPSELSFDDFIDVAYEMAIKEYRQLFNHDGLKGPVKLYMKNGEWYVDVTLNHHAHRIPLQTIVFTYTSRDVMNYTGSVLGF